MFVALFAVLFPEVRKPLPISGLHQFMTLMTFLPMRLVIIETEIAVEAGQRKSFGVLTTSHSPSATALA